jgi:hypothetical protein
MSVNNKKNESTVAATNQETFLVNIEDLRTAFGGEDTSAPGETNQVKASTVMCGGWAQG